MWFRNKKEPVVYESILETIVKDVRQQPHVTTVDKIQLIRKTVDNVLIQLRDDDTIKTRRDALASHYVTDVIIPNDVDADEIKTELQCRISEYYPVYSDEEVAHLVTALKSDELLQRILDSGSYEDKDFVYMAKKVANDDSWYNWENVICKRTFSDALVVARLQVKTQLIIRAIVYFSKIYCDSIPFTEIITKTNLDIDEIYTILCDLIATNKVNFKIKSNMNDQREEYHILVDDQLEKQFSKWLHIESSVGNKT